MNNIFSHLATFFIAMLVGLLAVTEAKSADLSMDDQSGGKGSIVSFRVNVQNAPNEVVSLGFEVQYDPSVLGYRSYSAGHLVSGFDFFDANNVAPGIVRAGGLVAVDGKISEGASGILISLAFEVVGHDDCQLQLAQLKDDIKTWTTDPGNFTGDHEVEEETEPGETPKTSDEDYSLNASESRINQPKSNTVNSSYSDSRSDDARAFSAMERPASEINKIIKRRQISKKNEDQNRPLQNDKKRIVSDSKAKAVKHQTPTAINKPPAINQIEKEKYTVTVTHMEEDGTSGWRLLVGIMFLFGGISCLSIFLSACFVGVLLWDLIKRYILVGYAP